jgi:hypothetical protein
VPHFEEITRDTIFDAASLTKVVATAHPSCCSLKVARWSWTSL